LKEDRNADNSQIATIMTQSTPHVRRVSQPLGSTNPFATDYTNAWLDSQASMTVLQGPTAGPSSAQGNQHGAGGDAVSQWLGRSAAFDRLRLE
jgi:hypothetical protein